MRSSNIWLTFGEEVASSCSVPMTPLPQAYLCSWEGVGGRGEGGAGRTSAGGHLGTGPQHTQRFRHSLCPLRDRLPARISQDYLANILLWSPKLSSGTDPGLMRATGRPQQGPAGPSSSTPIEAPETLLRSAGTTCLSNSTPSWWPWCSP